MNQIEAGALRELGIYGNFPKTNVLIKEFITGHNENFTEEEKDFIENIKQILEDKGFKTFLNFSQQTPKILAAKHREHKYAFNMDNAASYGPWSMRTDFGKCIYLHPIFISVPTDTSDDNIIGKVFHQQNLTLKNGEENGLDMIIDIEQYTYGYSGEHGTGLSFDLADLR